MWNNQKSAKLSLAFTYISIILLIALIIFLPWLITWYVEIKGRSQSLATTVMVTCYPCVPFAFIALLSLRRILINILKQEVFIDQNVTMLKRIILCCVFASIITLIAGIFYMPFYIVGASAAFSALVLSVIKNMFFAAIEKNKK